MAGFQDKALTDPTLAGVGSVLDVGSKLSRMGTNSTADILQGANALFKTVAPMATTALNEARFKSAMEPFLKFEEAELQNSGNKDTLSNIRKRRKQAEIDLLRNDPDIYQSVMEAVGGSSMAAENRAENQRMASLIAMGRSMQPEGTFLTDAEALEAGRKAEEVKLKAAQAAADLGQFSKMQEMEEKAILSRSAQVGSAYYNLVGSMVEPQMAQIRNFLLKTGGGDSEVMNKYLENVDGLQTAFAQIKKDMVNTLDSLDTTSAAREKAIKAFDDRVGDTMKLLGDLKDAPSVKAMSGLVDVFKKKLGLDFLQSAPIIAKFKEAGGVEGLQIVMSDLANQNLDGIRDEMIQFLTDPASFKGQNPIAKLEAMAAVAKDPNAISNMKDTNQRISAIKAVSDSMTAVQRNPETLNSESYGAMTSNLGFGLLRLNTAKGQNAALSTLANPEHAKMLSKMNSRDVKGATAVTSGGVVVLAGKAAKSLNGVAEQVVFNKETMTLSFTGVAPVGGIETEEEVPVDVAAQQAGQEAVRTLMIARDAYVNHAKYDPALTKLSEEELQQTFWAKVRGIGSKTIPDVGFPKGLTLNTATASAPAEIQQLIQSSTLAVNREITEATSATGAEERQRTAVKAAKLIGRQVKWQNRNAKKGK